MFLLTRAGVRGGALPIPDLLVDQLWRAAAGEGDLRLVGDPPTSGWHEAERYLVAPTLRQPRILLPDVPRRAVAAAVLSHRGLRPTRARLQRSLLALAVVSHLPLPQLSVQVRAGARRPELPLDRIKEALGEPGLHASISVRRGANRKATLQLVDATGRPRGYAKVAWDATSVAGLRREGAALDRATGEGLARAPEVLASGSVGGRPFLVTAPLPADARALRRPVSPPSAAELGTLCPLTGHAPFGRTGQLRALRERLEGLPAMPETAEVLESARAVVTALTSRTTPVPVTAHWHGDLTPWNCARCADGVLWVWDWESSEEDAAAGLDAYHWWWGVRSESRERLGRGMLPQLAVDAEPLLVALGVPRSSQRQVGALWAATIAERACALFTVRGEWDRGWVLPHELRELMHDAVQLAGGDRAAREPR